jgi:hypothetical protein
MNQTNPELTLIPPIKWPFWLLGGRDGRVHPLHSNEPQPPELTIFPPIKWSSWLLGGRDGRCISSLVVVVWYSSTYS